MECVQTRGKYGWLYLSNMLVHWWQEKIKPSTNSQNKRVIFQKDDKETFPFKGNTWFQRPESHIILIEIQNGTAKDHQKKPRENLNQSNVCDFPFPSRDFSLNGPLINCDSVFSVNRIPSYYLPVSVNDCRRRFFSLWNPGFLRFL